MQRLTDAEARYLNLLKRQRQTLLARDDLIDFARFMKPDPDHPDDIDLSLYQVARHHQAIAAALEQVEQGKIRRLIINVPPGTASRELSSPHVPGLVPRPPPRAVADPRHLRRQAQLGFRPRGQRAIIERRALPPGVSRAGASRPLSVDRIETTQGGKVFFVGRGSAITGRGATACLSTTRSRTATRPTARSPAKSCGPGSTRSPAPGCCPTSAGSSSSRRGGPRTTSSAG